MASAQGYVQPYNSAANNDYVQAYNSAQTSGYIDADGASYESVAKTLGISAYDVQNHLGQARDRLQELIVAIVADYVASPDDVADEINDLFST